MRALFLMKIPMAKVVLFAFLGALLFFAGWHFGQEDVKARLRNVFAHGVRR